jgi:hypothetical protein
MERQPPQARSLLPEAGVFAHFSQMSSSGVDISSGGGRLLRKAQSLVPGARGSVSCLLNSVDETGQYVAAVRDDLWG